MFSDDVAGHGVAEPFNVTARFSCTEVIVNPLIDYQLAVSCIASMIAKWWETIGRHLASPAEVPDDSGSDPDSRGRDA